jgi:hypothetical protein
MVLLRRLLTPVPSTCRIEQDVRAGTRARKRKKTGKNEGFLQ